MIDLWLLSPEIIVAAVAVLVLVGDLLLPAATSRKSLGILSAVGVAIALVATAGQVLPAVAGSSGISYFGGLLIEDTLAVSFKIIFLVTAFLVLLFSFNYVESRIERYQGEFYWLILTALLGMMITAASQELITIYVGIELISLSFYALVGFLQDDKASTEAALKYFILGSLAIGIWLYGATIMYGLTGSTRLAGIAEGLSGNFGPLAFLGLFLLIVGFGFKMGLAPFHMWVPDTYEGAPTPITAYLAVGSKAATFAVFLRVMLTAFAPVYANWAILVGVIAALTMTWGNIAAIPQTNIKRMLAYSGVAQAGYTLVGVVALNSVGATAVIFYLFGYLFANLGAFAVVVGFANRTGSDNIADYAGLRWRNPFLAFGLAMCLLSLAGIPPLVGFFGKLYLFLGAMQQGGWLMTLVIIAAINSAISLYYYVNVIRTMYFMQPVDDTPVPGSAGVSATVVIAIVGVLLATMYFQPVVSAIGAGSVAALLSPAL